MHSIRRRSARVTFESLEQRQLMSATPTHLALADQLVNGITPANNVYSHGVATLTWAGRDGETVTSNDSDCSAFETALLKEAYGFTNSQFTTWTGKTAPQAKDYYNAAAADKGFDGFAQIADVRPGDLIVSKYLDSTSDTGHMMTVDLAPVLISTTSTQRIYNVTVVDSTGSVHSSDTRNVIDPGTGVKDTGVGRGTIHLFTDLGGNLVTWSWGTSSSSTVYDPASRPILFAKTPLGVVAAPASLVGYASTSSVNLSWTDRATNETKYLVERADDGGAFARIATLGKNLSGWSDASVLAGRTYTYRVSAINAYGVSDDSNAVTVQMAKPAPVVAPRVWSTTFTPTAPLAPTVTSPMITPISKTSPISTIVTSPKDRVVNAPKMILL